MARPRIFTDEELVEVLAKMEKTYGYIGIDTMQKAHNEEPFEYPSYKMFERRLGGMKTFNTPDFRDRIQPFLEKIEADKDISATSSSE